MGSVFGQSYDFSTIKNNNVQNCLTSGNYNLGRCPFLWNAYGVVEIQIHFANFKNGLTMCMNNKGFNYACDMKYQAWLLFLKESLLLL